MGLPGVPSSSLTEMPAEGLRWGPGRRARASYPLGTVLGAGGDAGGTGGENGAGFVTARMLAELALRARSFSARWARKKISSGDSSRASSVGRRRCCGVAASESVAGGDGSPLMRLVFLTPGESSALARKLGMGNDDGAGDAWNVAPAKAGAAMGLGATVCGGVVRPCFAGAGDMACFGRGLFAPLRGLVLGWLGCGSRAGLFEADFCGVNGPASSIGKGASDGMSFSEA